MNRILKVGDRVKILSNTTRILWLQEIIIQRIKNLSELINSLEDYPVEVVEVSEAWSGKTRYRIELHSVLSPTKKPRKSSSVFKWVDEDDITLDIEYYRNEKLNKLLENE